MTNESKNSNSNPCGICRAFGFPVCKGHGGSGGSDEAKDEASKKDKNPNARHVPTTLEVKNLASYLEDSAVWNCENDFLYTFNNDLALFSIDLDQARGLIHFKGNEFLSTNSQEDLNELYNKITEEFNRFTDEVSAKNSSILREGNHLIISIPAHNHYDQFVTRLLNKNLIPNNNYKADLVCTANQNAKLPIHVKEAATSYKLPNPFDVSKGPRPSKDF